MTIVLDGVTEISPSRALITAGWNDVPHIDEATKAELLRSTPPHLRKARSEGIPSLGSGAIYPVALEEISVDPFPIPAWWPRGYALDVGWNRTAATWGAWDRESDVLYLTAEYYAAQAVPAIHAKAISTRGAWMTGMIDPAARGRSQVDGTRLLDEYLEAGLTLEPADNAVEAGLLAVWDRMVTGRLKVFTTLRNWQNEFRMYRRDERGRVVKENDHAMDTMRYNVMGFREHYRVRPAEGAALGPAGFAADTRAGY